MRVGVLSWTVGWPWLAPLIVVVGIPLSVAGCALLLVFGPGDSNGGKSSPARDASPPTITNLTVTPTGTVLTGDTLSIAFTATDDSSIAYDRVTLQGTFSFVDSIAENGSTHVDRVVQARVPAATNSLPLDVEVDVADKAGNVGHSSQLVPLSVSPYIRRPLRSAPLGAAVRDLVYDGKRGKVYLSEPDSQRIAVLDVASFTYDAPIALPFRQSGLDLTPGSDSLIVALRRSSYLGVVNLTNPAHPVDTVRLAFDTSIGRGPDHVRVAATGVALVSITFDGTGYGGLLLSYDLRSGVQQDRSAQVGILGNVSDAAVLARSRDGSRLSLVDGECPGNGFIYVAASDSFSPARATTAGYCDLPTAVDSTGLRFLIGQEFADDQLNQLRRFVPPDIQFGHAAALTADALTVFYDAGSGFSRLRTADGATLELVFLPERPPTQLLLAPGDQTLIAVTATKVWAVDLR